MLKPLIRSVDRIRFEGPLALLLGASAAFAVFAMPRDLFGTLPGAEELPFAQPAFAVVTALLLAVIAFFAMRRPKPRRAPDLWPDDLDYDDDVEGTEDEPTVRMRRADRHPDAPPRQPIRASRDLGEPFMEVGNPAAPAPAPAPVFDEPDEDEELRGWISARETFDDVEEEETPAPAPVRWLKVEPEAIAPKLVEPEPIEDEQFAPLAEAAEEPAETVAAAPIAAFEPEPAPVPATSRASRQSLSAMMERLSTGLERRGGAAPTGVSPAALIDAAGRPRDLGQDLRGALDELNRLAGRRN